MSTVSERCAELTSIILDEQRRHLVLRKAVEAHLIAFGPCDDTENCDDPLCDNPECTYCDLARAEEGTR